MGYLVKEIFYTLQGEGTHVGTPAVFCRFAGCNLWTGRESHRHSAKCQFCDTDFVGTDGPGGGKFTTADDLAQAVSRTWGAVGGLPGGRRRFVVCTGGEPLLQLDSEAVDALHRKGFFVAVETNGTLEAPQSVDWVCVSPKAGTQIRLARADELKLVYPQEGIGPDSFEGCAVERLLLQPMDGPDLQRNTALAVQYCLDHPKWKLSLQTHKYIGIP